MSASTPLSSTSSPTPSVPSAQMNVAPLAVPPRDACRLLSIGMSRLYRLMRSGELPSYWDGRARRITVASIHDYVAQRLADANTSRQAKQPRRRGPASKVRVSA